VLDADFFLRWMTATAASVDREAERLTALDSPIGDADHGSNLQRGFRAIVTTQKKESPNTPSGVLTLAGRQLISTVGGASGPLYGTLLRRTGKALGPAAEVSLAEFAAALRELGVPVETGVFGARMAIELVNDGPVTIVLDL
jgi:dihydroxyacetone kinase-like protein